MNKYKIAEIADIIGGELFTDAVDRLADVSQIIIDSRTFFKGNNSIFFALVGPRNNGHNYITELIKKGISVFVVSNPDSILPGASFIVVEDTTKALQKLATYNRHQNKYPVIGITGSNGKTVIKEWLHHLLSGEFNIVRSPKSFNSQIGVPLSVLLMDTQYNLGIFEAGISQVNEMDKLAAIVSPEIGVFTNIGDAHQENFDSMEQKVIEKLRLFKNCKKLIYCADSIISNPIIDKFCAQNKIEKVSWSFDSTQVKILFTSTQKDDNTNLTASIENTKYNFSIPFTDRSAIENSCHCFAVAYTLLKNPSSLLPKFRSLETIAMRLQIKQGINGCLLVNDYYNSDLNSLSIALAVLNQQAAKAHLKKVVILSDIQQTGTAHPALYKKVNELLTEWQIDEIVGIGKDILHSASEFSMKKVFYTSTKKFQKQFNRNHFRSSAILIKGARQFTFEKISGLLQNKAHQTELEINLNALVNNLNVFKSLLKPTSKIMVMVKAFSYGSGDVEIAKLLQYQNVDYLAVAIADEGVELRNAGISLPIIVMNPEFDSFQNIIDYQLEPNIYGLELLEDFSRCVSQNGIVDFPVHLKIDTGMNRLGFKTNDEIQQLISIISSNSLMKIKSIFSHLAASDEPELDDFTSAQFNRFEECFKEISESFEYNIDRHILNSAGIERFPEKQFEMVRLGIGLYGVSHTGLPLQNIGTLKSTVSQIKKVNSDETIGYGRMGKTNKESAIAIVPLGYADGLDRKLGNKNGEAFINGKRVRIIGNICMDMLMLDVSGLEVKIGDKVEFFGPNISIMELAKNIETIPYEILTGISQRVKRVYVQE